MQRKICKDKFNIAIYLYEDDNPSYFKKKGYFNDDPKLIDFLHQNIKKGWTVFDVGAMRGYITVLAANIVGLSGQVHSFEPEEKNYQRLLENISLNHYKNVTANKLAVYDRVGVLSLNVFKERGWHSMGIPVVGGKEIQPIQKQNIRAITLDSYCQTKQINKINLVKIDVEGAEKNVFEGSEDLLKRKAIDMIIFEVSKPPLQGMKTTVDALYRLILKFDYNIYTFAKNSKSRLKKIKHKAKLNVSFGNFVALPN